MVALPSGTVTFLFTDLEGSTRLWEEQREAMTTALTRHDAIVRAAIEAHQGRVVKTTGDGFHGVFARPHDALGAAVEAQRAVARETGEGGVQLLVRMGVHTGAGEERDGDYYGTAVNRAARLMGVAHGGQVLTTRAVQELVADELDDSVELISLGEHRLRDLTQPIEVFQVVAPGLEREFPALQSLEAFPGNLPVQHSSFVGREREVSEIAALVREARIVTLTGVGGVGKTRLACQVAAEALPEFRNGAWIAELARVRDPNVVVDAVAAVFGVNPRPGVELLDTLVGYLRPKELLLVLDNCEHLLGAVVDVVRALEEKCPGLVVLSTSREGLGIAGERIVVVPSLGVPRTSDRDAVLSSDAARLLLDRAVAVQSDFEVTDANADAVAEVVRRVDGIPLALELAAARIPVLSPAQLAQRLDQRFRVLAGGERGAVERHATLRAAIDWSYDLLSTDEQRMLARLSVFAGSCSLEGAEAVCSGAGIDEVDVLDLLAALVARSLVVAEDAPSGERRYRLLETIRQYAEERLAGEERSDLRDRHAAYYVTFTERADEGVRGPDQLRWILEIESELENVRAAMAWSVATDNVIRAAQFLCTLRAGPNRLAQTLFTDAEAVLALPGIDTVESYPFVLVSAAGAALFRGTFEEAVRLGQEALDSVDEPGDELVGWVSMVRGNAFYCLGDMARAVESMERSVSARRRVGDPYQLGFSLGGLASWRPRHDLGGAAEEARESLSLARQIGCPGAISGGLALLALILVGTQPEESRALIAESIELNKVLGAIVVDENALVMAFLVTALLGEREQTLELTAQGLDRGFSMLVGLCSCLEATAQTLAPDQAEAAATLQGAVDGLVPVIVHAEPYRALRRRATRAMSTQLDDVRISELRAQGAAMSEDQATVYALDAIARAR
jgi:predicted ATPase/class 3 adenylate cyclase